MIDYKIGFSTDIHRFKNEGDYILLGGVKIKTDNLSIVAHSDGDCLLHALAESILSSLGMEDLGTYFDDRDAKFLNYDSKKILKFSLDELYKRNWKIRNVCINITLQQPRLSEYKNLIKENLCQLLNLNKEDISVHAGTNEKLDDIGKGLAIKVDSTILIYKEV